MENTAMGSHSLLDFMTCKFCGVDRKELYKCPRCETHYCSIKCYQNETHASCSEEFYKKCVENELKGKRCSTESGGKETFEEHMQKFLDGKLEELPGDIYGQDNKDEGELLDSDDEINDEDEYMKKVLQSTIDDYTLEESEIDRRLMCLGVGSDVEQLMLKLTDEEKTAYAQLAEQIHLDETGLEDSCFRSKT